MMLKQSDLGQSVTMRSRIILLWLASITLVSEQTGKQSLDNYQYSILYYNSMCQSVRNAKVVKKAHFQKQTGPLGLLSSGRRLLVF